MTRTLLLLLLLLPRTRLFIGKGRRRGGAFGQGAPRKGTHPNEKTPVNRPEEGVRKSVSVIACVLREEMEGKGGRSRSIASDLPPPPPLLVFDHQPRNPHLHTSTGTRTCQRAVQGPGLQSFSSPAAALFLLAPPWPGPHQPSSSAPSPPARPVPSLVLVSSPHQYPTNQNYRT